MKLARFFMSKLGGLMLRFLTADHIDLDWTLGGGKDFDQSAVQNTINWLYNWYFLIGMFARLLTKVKPNRPGYSTQERYLISKCGSRIPFLIVTCLYDKDHKNKLLIICPNWVISLYIHNIRCFLYGDFAELYPTQFEF